MAENQMIVGDTLTPGCVLLDGAGNVRLDSAGNVIIRQAWPVTITRDRVVTPGDSSHDVYSSQHFYGQARQAEEDGDTKVTFHFDSDDSSPYRPFVSWMVDHSFIFRFVADALLEGTWSPAHEPALVGPFVPHYATAALGAGISYTHHQLRVDVSFTHTWTDVYGFAYVDSFRVQINT